MVALWSLLLTGAAYYLQLAQAWAINSSPPPTAAQIVQDLSARLSSGSLVVLASNATIDPQFTQRFSVSHSPSFLVAVKPKAVNDVRQVIQYARANGVPLLTTGGGHGYSWSLARLQGGIDLDLSFLSDIKINPSANTLTISGSVQTRDVINALQAAGREIPVGMCPCVGFTGFTLGGGIGPYSGLYGAASDSLLSADIVTGRGDLLAGVSATNRPDLFFGIKGAGFNYGVVTSLTYRVYPATNSGKVVVTNMIFPGALNGTIWQTLGRLFGRQQQPKELSIALSVGYNPAQGGIVLIVGFIYAGPIAASNQTLQPFLDLNPLNLQVLPDTPWENMTNVVVYGAVAASSCQKNTQFVPYSVNLYEVDVPNLVGVLNYMADAARANPPLASVMITWAQYANYGFVRYADASGAFPHRDVAVFVQVNALAPSADQIPVLNDHAVVLRDQLQKGSGRSQLETYVHFAHGDEGPQAWYSARKLAALKALKKVYDPAGMFSWYNPVR